MFKCRHCKKQSEKGETPFTRTKYKKVKNEEGKIVRGNIIEIKRPYCFKCYKKLGAEIN